MIKYLNLDQVAGQLKIFLLWLILFGFPLMLAYFVYSAQSWVPENILTIENVKHLHSYSIVPPPNNIDDWAAIVLPDDWQHTHDKSRNVWYQFTLDLNVPPNRLWAIYLPTIYMNTAVYLNNQLLGDGGRFEEPMARNWNHPQYFVIPNGMLNSGENVFQIRLASPSLDYGYLGKIHLAPNAVLRSAYDFRYFIEVALAQIITASLIIMGLFMGALWLLRRNDSVYGWFAICLFIWAIHNLNLFVINIPVSTRVWEWLWFVTMVWFVIAITIFVHRFTETQRPQFEKYILTIGITGSVILFVLPEYWFYKLGYRVWDTLAVLLGLYPSYMLIVAYRTKRDISAYILLLSGLLILIFGAHDWLMLNQFLGREEGLMLHFAAPLPLFVFSWILLTRFVQVLDEAESLNVDLEKRVEEKHLELEQNYRRLQQLEKEQVLVMERERIMRDMHDGMGGHLISTLSMVEASNVNKEEILEALHAALDDLRIMIDSLDPVEDDLTSVLAMYRARIQPRLEKSNISVNWNVTDIPRIPGLGPEKVLQVLRIIQEAISNVIKHADANEITFHTRERILQGEHGVSVEIKDNGNGHFQVKPVGRGLDNMRKRAEQIGAIFDIQSQSTGTIVSLWFSLSNENGQATKN